jgi:hypothetical protein
MRQGRIWEFGMALRFYLTSDILHGLQNVPLALSLIRRGLMPIFPPKKVKGGREVAAIMNKVEAIQKAGGTR